MADARDLKSREGLPSCGFESRLGHLWYIINGVRFAQRDVTMTDAITQSPADVERREMHEIYRDGGRQRERAPHVVYSQSTCPHPDCDCRMQAIDFRLEDHGRSVHDPLVRAWWDDTGFAGRCPQCQRWVHFTIRAMQAIDDSTAAGLPQLPDDWFAKATVL